MRTTNILAWIAVVSALLSMMVGHLGSHELSWMSNQISTYAAVAPYGDFVTAAMLLSALVLLLVGFIVSEYQIFGSSRFSHFAPALSGAAASGLLMLSYYEETAITLSALKQSSFWAIRIQSFHDAGLQIFFYSALLLAIMLGSLAMFYKSKVIDKVLGGLIFSMGPASYFIMTTGWPRYIGFDGVAVGVNQRAALFCLWFAIALTLIISSRSRVN